MQPPRSETDAYKRKAASMQRIILILILIPFTVLTGLALWHHGYWGIIEPHFQTFGAAQVLADLVIALCLVLTWIWHDAARTGRTAWPWIALTLVTGSFGPLLYLLTAKPASRLP
jgi:hypothetical protein